MVGVDLQRARAPPTPTPTPTSSSPSGTRGRTGGGICARGASAAEPEFGADFTGRDRGAELDGEQEAEATQRDALVFHLRAALAGMGPQPGGRVREIDEGLDLVSVLAAGAAGAAAGDFALGEQGLVGERGGMCRWNAQGDTG